MVPEPTDGDAVSECDVTAERRELNVLRYALDQPAQHQEQVVWVSVSGRPLALPVPVLSEGLSDLRLTTEACVGLADYAAGVAIVLSALERAGIVTVVRKPDRVED